MNQEEIDDLNRLITKSKIESVIKKKLPTNKSPRPGTFLVAQWLRIHLPIHVTWVQALVQEDPTCRGATKPVRQNYWACALEPACHNY